MQCEGWRRYGGAFTLGPVTWRQCANEAVVTLEFIQEGKPERMPACMTCWDEATRAAGIQITSATPLPVGQAQKDA
jgi:hypothetical protein